MSFCHNQISTLTNPLDTYNQISQSDREPIFCTPGAKREKRHVGEPVRILVLVLLLIGARFLSQNQGIAGLQMTSWRPCRTKALGVRWELM